MLNVDPVTVRRFRAEIAIHGVKVQAVSPRDQGEYLFQIPAQRPDIFWSSGKTAGRAYRGPICSANGFLFETRDIISLPAVDGEGYFFQFIQRALRVDAVRAA